MSHLLRLSDDLLRAVAAVLRSPSLSYACHRTWRALRGWHLCATRLLRVPEALVGLQRWLPVLRTVTLTLAPQHLQADEVQALAQALLQVTEAGEAEDSP